jgi:hypothetical protein
MEHLIPTLLGLAGALAPVAFVFLKHDAPAVRPLTRFQRTSAAGADLLFADAIVRGGRVYL